MPSQVLKYRSGREETVEWADLSTKEHVVARAGQAAALGMAALMPEFLLVAGISGARALGGYLKDRKNGFNTYSLGYPIIFIPETKFNAGTVENCRARTASSLMGKLSFVIPMQAALFLTMANWQGNSVQDEAFNIMKTELGLTDSKAAQIDQARIGAWKGSADVFGHSYDVSVKDVTARTIDSAAEQTALKLDQICVSFEFKAKAQPDRGSWVLERVDQLKDFKVWPSTGVETVRGARDYLPADWNVRCLTTDVQINTPANSLR